MQSHHMMLFIQMPPHQAQRQDHKLILFAFLSWFPTNLEETEMTGVMLWEVSSTSDWLKDFQNIFLKQFYCRDVLFTRNGLHLLQAEHKGILLKSWKKWNAVSYLLYWFAVDCVDQSIQSFRTLTFHFYFRKYHLVRMVWLGYYWFRLTSGEKERVCMLSRQCNQVRQEFWALSPVQPVLHLHTLSQPLSPGWDVLGFYVPLI